MTTHTHTHSPGFLALVEQARQHVREISIPEYGTRHQRGEHPVLIDVREEHEWSEGHIPGALHLGKGIIERDIEATVPDRATHLVLYCGGGFRSALAADALQKMGYTRVASMDGGWREWTARGLPVSTDA